jgi:hypothetical protein
LPVRPSLRPAPLALARPAVAPCALPVRPSPLASAQPPIPNRLGARVRGCSWRAGGWVAGKNDTSSLTSLPPSQLHGLGQLGLVKKFLGQIFLGMPGHIGAYPWRRRWCHYDNRSQCTTRVPMWGSRHFLFYFRSCTLDTAFVSRPARGGLFVSYQTCACFY